MCHDHEHAELAGMDELGEERRAIGIAPVGVVDEDHDRPDARQPGEQLAQRREPAPAQLGTGKDVQVLDDQFIGNVPREGTGLKGSGPQQRRIGRDSRRDSWPVNCRLCRCMQRRRWRCGSCATI